MTDAPSTQPTAPAPDPAPVDAPATWSPGRRIAAWINTIVMVLLVAAILVGLNFLAARHFFRYDWTSDQRFTLSEKTRTLLANLKAPVEFCVAIPDRGMSAVDANALKRLRHLIDEYRVRAPLLTSSELMIGMPSQVIQAKMKDLNLQTLPSYLSLVVSAGGRNKTLALSSLYEAEYGGGGPYGGGPVGIKSFNAEGPLTTAIRELTGEKPPVVYYAEGHGATEGRIARGGRGDERGISWIANRVKERENIDFKSINLIEAKAFPEDCRILVIHRPSTRYGEKEIAALHGFLKRGGRLCVMLDALSEQRLEFVESGLEGFLHDWGVAVGRNLVLAYMQNIFNQVSLEYKIPLFKNHFGFHPIVDKLKGEEVSVLLPASRSVARADDAPSHLDVTPLLTIPEGAWGETSLEQFQRGRAAPDGADLQGSVTLAVAVKAPVEPGAADSLSKESRLVVFGNGAFILDGIVESESNEDLYANALLWLVDREQDIGIGPKPVASRQITLNDRRKSVVLWVCWFGLPGIGVLVGIGLWFVRRK